MHNASTKQRLAALRRKLGIFTGWQPRWVRERKERRERLARSSERDAGLVAVATSEAATVVGPPPAVEPERAPAPTPRADAPAAPQSTTQLPTTTAAPVGPDTAPAGPWHVSRPAAPSRPAHGRAGRLPAAVALAAIGIAALMFGLPRRAPAPGASAADRGGLERAAGRDARVTAASATPAEHVLVGARDGSAVEVPARAQDESSVEVRPGDSLWRIAGARLGNPMRWPELHMANAGQVHDPDLIFPGQRLRIPAVRL